MRVVVYIFTGYYLSFLMTSKSRAGDALAKEPFSSNDPARAPVPGFRLSGGWMHRSLKGGVFHSESQSQNVVFPRFLGRDHRADPRVGPSGSPGNRRYDDGFVNTDAGTDNDGATAHWGYDNPSQARDGSLWFHAEGTRREVHESAFYEDIDDWNLDPEGNAPVVQLDWSTEVAGGWSVGVQAQWSLLHMEEGHSASSFTFFSQRNDYVTHFKDGYALRGVIPPSAPYEGSDAGNGALLDNVPAFRRNGETVSGKSRAHLHNSVQESLDVDVHTLSLGPTAGARIGRVNAQIAGGLSVTVADWDARHREVLYLSRDGARAREWRSWESRSGGTKVLPGFYLQSSASVSLTKKIDISAFGRYDWCGEMQGKVGPSSFTVDLSGWSAGAMIGVRF